VPRSLNEDILMYTWWWKERECSDNERERETERERGRMSKKGMEVLPLTSPKATLECPIIKMLSRRF